jgi:hypothetical protein
MAVVVVVVVARVVVKAVRVMDGRGSDGIVGSGGGCAGDGEVGIQSWLPWRCWRRWWRQGRCQGW